MTWDYLAVDAAAGLQYQAALGLYQSTCMLYRFYIVLIEIKYNI